MTIPPSLSGKVSGLLGNFNGKSVDDFSTPIGTLWYLFCSYFEQLFRGGGVSLFTDEVKKFSEIDTQGGANNF